MKSNIPFTPPPPPRPNRFLLPLLLMGGFLFLLLIAFGAGGFLLYNHGSLNLGSSEKNPLKNVAQWQVGQQRSQIATTEAQPDIDWYNSWFSLPPTEAVMAYLAQKGLTVGRIEPLHYKEDKETIGLTYRVYAQVPSRLIHLNQIYWHASTADEARFAKVLVLNAGLPAGQLWDTQNPTVAAEANSKLSFDWTVHVDKTFNVVTTDRPPFPESVYTPQEVSAFQAESEGEVAALKQELKQIDSQVASYRQTQLAQIPQDPPKPEMLPNSFGGDGSGEPTKSGARIGGGAAAGAAAGAGFGAIAGDAGVGAGAGAAVGLISGIIYDAVSKSNDRKRHERAVAAENQERLDSWQAEIKSLDQQRAAVKQQVTQLKEKLLSDLANRIATQNGKLTAPPLPVTTSEEKTMTAPPAPAVVPDSSTPTGPVRP